MNPDRNRVQIPVMISILQKAVEHQEKDENDDDPHSDGDVILVLYKKIGPVYQRLFGG